MPCNNKSAPSIVAPAAQDAHADVIAARDEPPNSVCGLSAGIFHKLQAGDTEPLGRETVDLSHLGSSESFHGDFRAWSEHPAATHVDHLAGNILGLFGNKKCYGGGDVLDRRRTPNRKTRVTHAAGLVEAQFF